VGYPLLLNVTDGFCFRWGEEGGGVTSIYKTYQPVGLGLRVGWKQNTRLFFWIRQLDFEAYQLVHKKVARGQYYNSP
jgi:hypothetical protein